ncbi:MAG TPA: glycosyltransferase [Pyrinomonadaceae bacterium]|jgi:glycosyltransferase involved in cell wall biosynthesis|nr:glycosyltransferase [Pyrinomonadaceae bacterium]
MRISVIVPVRNEAKSISTLIDGLLAQSRPPDEIIITDGGSTDGTAAIIDDYISRGAPIQLIKAGPTLPGRGRNLGTRRSSNEWLAYIDAGVRPEKEWLAALARRASQEQADVVYGSYEPVVATFFKECAAIAYVSPPDTNHGASMRSHFIACTLMRRKVWEQVGGFPEHLRSAEDLLFMDRIKDAGFAISYEPEANVHWDLQPNFWRTFKRFVTYSENNIRASLWKRWQAPIFKRYLVILVSVLLMPVFGYRWVFVPIALWLMMLSARAFAALWRNRHCYPASPVRNLQRFFALIPLIATLDAATFAGTLRWFFKDGLRLSDKAARVRHGA